MIIRNLNTYLGLGEILLITILIIRTNILVTSRKTRFQGHCYRFLDSYVILQRPSGSGRPTGAFLQRLVFDGPALPA